MSVMNSSIWTSLQSLTSSAMSLIAALRLSTHKAMSEKLNGGTLVAIATLESFKGLTLALYALAPSFQSSRQK